MATASSTHVPRDGWLKDTKCLPRMFGHDCIMQHIQKSGKHSMYVEKPLQKGYRFFFENYVHNIEAVKQESFVYVRARCYRSQRKNESPHSINIRLSDDGHVADAKCSCAAGVQGLCNHVVGLLYNVNHVIVMGLKEFPEAGTCTDNPQQWHKPRTSGIKPEPIMGYTVIRPSYSSSSNNTRGLCCTLYEARDSRIEKPDEAQKLVETMAKINPNFGICKNVNLVDCHVPTVLGCRAMVGSTLSHQLALSEGDFHVSCDTSATDSVTDGSDLNLCLPITVVPFVNLADYRLSNEEEKVISDLDISRDDAHELEAKTVGQANNTLWKDSRLNRLTASNFGLICKRRVVTEKFTKSVLTEVNDLSHVPAIKYGRENETRARERYTKYMANAGYNIKVLQSGLVVNPSFPWLGASPDGKIIDSKAGLGLLEIKCPMSFRDIDPLDACSDNTFYCRLVDGKPMLKRGHTYYYQIQGQMGTCGAQWCDFVVYTKKGMIVSRVKFEEDFWFDMFTKLTNFYMTSCVKLLCKK